MGQTHLAVVIPAFNEEERIGPSLQTIHAYLTGRGMRFAVIVVNDGSRDRTAEIVRDFASSHPEVTLIDSQPNQGKGAVVRIGMLAAEADWLLISDADLATPIEELEKLEARISDEVPIAIGSRPLRESRLEVRQPLYREYGGRAFNKLVQLLGVRGIQDTQCGFKLFRQAEARQIFQRCQSNGWGFDFEALMIAQDLGFRIAEVGVRWRHMEGSKFSPFRDAPKMLSELVRLRMKGKARRLAGRPGDRAD